MSVLQRIVSRRTQLSESGRQIGDWVLANAAQAAAMTSQDLAAWANVSQSSIVKFTQRLGFKGYSEFKLALTESWDANKSWSTSLYTATSWPMTPSP